MPYVGNTGEDEAIRQNGNDQGPDQRSPDRTDTADEGGATQDNSGDRVELVGLAELQPIGSIEARRLHGPAKPGQQPRHPIDEDQHSPDLDAGQTCRTLVTADRIDMHPEHGATQYQPRAEDDEQCDHREPGNRNDAGKERQGTVADKGIGNGGVEDSGVGAQEARQTAHGGQRTERDDEGRQAKQRNQGTIDDAEDEAGEYRGRQPERPKIRKLGDNQPGHRGGG